MIKVITIILLFGCYLGQPMHAQGFTGPDTVLVQSDQLILKGLLWHPIGSGSFPTIIFCHGSYESSDSIDPVQQTSLIGPVFAKNGYIFLDLFQRGVGLSKEQGVNSADLMSKAMKEKGQQERNKVQLQQLETDQLKDMIAGLQYLRRRKDVDKNRMAVVGLLWRITCITRCRA